jgi:WD40 repeat protein
VNRYFLCFLLSFLAGFSNVHSAENPPLQDPQLRIEAGFHTSHITFDVSADGQLLVTGSNDKTVRLWSLPAGTLLRTFRVPSAPGIEGCIYAVAISPGGRYVAAGGNTTAANGEFLAYIYLFDTISGAVVRRLGPFSDNILSLAFSPGGRRLAASLNGRSGIRLWRWPLDTPPTADSDFFAPAYGVSFDASSWERIAAIGNEPAIRVYDPQLRLLGRSYLPGGNWPNSLAYSPDGKTVAVGYYDNTNIDLLRVSKLTDIYKVNTDFAIVGTLSSVAWSTDGRYLYAGGRFRTKAGKSPIVRWDRAGRGDPQAVAAALHEITGIKGLPDGSFAFSSNDPSFGLYGPDGKQILYQPPVTADMHAKHSGNFSNAPDAMGVWFGLYEGDGEPWNFNVRNLTFEAKPERPQTYIEPETRTLDVRNWIDSYYPKLNGKIIQLDDFETSHAIAIAPDAKSFVLGAEWTIYRYDSAGKLMWRILVPHIVRGINLSGDGSIIVAAHGDGTIRWYRASDGAELLAFFVHVPDKRWVAWTPSGYYSASPSGEDLIGWHVNGKTWRSPVNFYPASLFRNRFYRPDIVQLVLRTKDEAHAVEQANLIAKRKAEEEGIGKVLPPVVEILADPGGIEANQPELALKYRLRSPSGQAITRLELRIDGQLAQSRAVETFDDNLALDVELTLAVLLPARDSVVSLTAFIDEQPSATVSISIKWTGTVQKTPKPKLFALLVGVSDYDEPRLKLNYAAKDAMDVEAALKRQKGRFFEEVETVLLLNKKADEDEIEIELSRLRKKVGKDDYAVVFMAGHGVTDAQGGFHFLPANASLSEDELAARSLNGLVIRDNLRTIQGKVLFFMDACNAGNGIGSDQALADMTGFVNEFAQSNGVVMYASSAGRQFSYEGPKWNNGAYTKALVTTLDDPDAFGTDGKLSIFELADQLDTRVRKMTGDLQTPVMTKSAAIPNFHVASVQ